MKNKANEEEKRDCSLTTQLKSRIFPFVTFCLFNFLLGSCIQTNGEVSDCPSAKPKAIILDPSALILHPFSYTHHFFSSKGNTIEAHRTLTLRVSESDSANALIQLDSNQLDLYLGSTQIKIPEPFYSGGTGWHCPDYNETKIIDISGSGQDTSIKIEIKNSNVITRAWSLSFQFDSTKIPEFEIGTIPGGLTIKFPEKQNLELSEVNIQPVKRNWSQRLSFHRAEDIISASIQFKDLFLLKKQMDSLEIARETFNFCIGSDSGIESIHLNSNVQPVATEICKEIEGAAHNTIIEYLKKNCTNCN